MKSNAPVIQSDPEILGGTPVFPGTRVPVQTLFDYLEAGDSLDRFLDEFPSVSREQAIAVVYLDILEGKASPVQRQPIPESPDLMA